MKKYILHLCIIVGITLSTSFSWADDCKKSCTIKDQPAPELREYIKTSKNLLGKISAQTSGKGTKTDMSAQLQRLYNYYIFSWDSYFTRFQYSVLLPLGNEIPPAIHRDYNLIQNEIKYQNDFVSKLAKKGVLQVEVSDICGDIHNCDLEGPAGDLAFQILANTNKLANLYRLSVSGDESQASSIDIKFGKEIAQAIIKHYNKRTIAHCSACEGATLNKILTSIENIGRNNASYKKGKKEWVDAWNLLWGIDKQSNEEEQIALRKELKRQGFSSSTSEVMVENLKKYQDGGSYINNNFIVNSGRALANSFTDAWNEFDEAIDSNLEESDDNETTIINFDTTTGDVGRSNEIATIIQSLYVSQVPYASTQDNSAGKALTRVMNIHLKLTHAIKILTDTIPLSERACNEQHKGEGICSAGE